MIFHAVPDFSLSKSFPPSSFRCPNGSTNRDSNAAAIEWVWNTAPAPANAVDHQVQQGFAEGVRLNLFTG